MARSDDEPCFQRKIMSNWGQEEDIQVFFLLWVRFSDLGIWYSKLYISDLEILTWLGITSINDL